MKDEIPDHCPLSAEELQAIRAKLRDDSVDVAGSSIRLSLLRLLALVGAVAAAGGVYFVTQRNIEEHTARLEELRPIPDEVRHLSSESRRQAETIFEIRKEQQTARELLIRIDERTNQTAKDIADLKSRK